MPQPPTFQEVILKLHNYWAGQGCVIWGSYNVQLGAGTGNPATTLRVLGPEPWRVAYVEPSVRPDDGRFGENPNRMQKYYQYQVILKPDPGNPQELYLQSLAALGIDARQQDIRFVEDNWESPALGAWGLGWEVWLNGQEITQFTYFQQAGGQTLDPVSVEITYGIERIVLALQGKESAWTINWLDGLAYGDLLLNEEIEHCRYYFDLADVDALRQVYQTYEQEHRRALQGDALIAAYDYVLKCSHLFNVLDTRGAIGVTERAQYFRRMREMTRSVAEAYLVQRERMGYPLQKMAQIWRAPAPQNPAPAAAPPSSPADLLLEIGVEEMPAQDVALALQQARASAPAFFEGLSLPHAGIEVYATPRRIALLVRQLAPRQSDREWLSKGPPADRAFDADGQPTRAAIGFARARGIALDALQIMDMDGGRYVVATLREAGMPSSEVLAHALPDFIASLKFPRTMRWNASAVSFSRPIRWIAALLGDILIPFAYAGVASAARTRGLRSLGSPALPLASVADYESTCREQGILLDETQRQQRIWQDLQRLAQELDGQVQPDAELLAEVTQLVEAPTAFHGQFDRVYLELPRDVLTTVMRKHQRYFAVHAADATLLPNFIAVRNGDSQGIDNVIRGNEQVLRARFSDAQFFFQSDCKLTLAQHLQGLDTLTFQAELGSMLAKNNRVAASIAGLGRLLGFAQTDIEVAAQAAALAKADLATSMVVEMTSLQGIMGREYALREGLPPAVASAIREHWLPSAAADPLPSSPAGTLLALADKLDSLVGLIAVGLLPSATSDPFALRRTALGILRIMTAAEITVDLAHAVELVAAGQPLPVDAQRQAQVLDFVAGRLASWMSDRHQLPPDVIRAVLDAQAQNPQRALLAAQTLAQWTQREGWPAILDSYARCARITRSEAPASLDPNALQSPQEQALYAQCLQAEAQLAASSPSMEALLTALGQLVSAIQDFFEHVLVHADDLQLRQNRIALLQRIAQLPAGIANLNVLDGF